MFEDKYFVELDTLPQKKLIDLIEDYIEDKKPDLVFIPMGNSYNQDHRATFEASITALRPAQSVFVTWLKMYLFMKNLIIGL